MPDESTLTAERVRSLLDYDPGTGVFRWKVRRGHVMAGAVAGCLDDRDYRKIGIDQKVWLAHRLAWLHVFGVWPIGEIDHRNENPQDNRITNLREATHSENRQNQSRPFQGNTSGYIGVTRHNHGWRAAIGIDGGHRYLGWFKTPEEASVAYLEAKAELHPFAHVNVL